MDLWRGTGPASLRLAMYLKRKIDNEEDGDRPVPWKALVTNFQNYNYEGVYMEPHGYINI